MVTTHSFEGHRRIEALDGLLSAYRKTLAASDEQVESAMRERDSWRERVKTLEGLLEFERARMSVATAPDKSNPYRGLSFREAVVKVIEKADAANHGRDTGEVVVTDEEIISALVSWAFPLDLKSPGRSIHAALMRVDSIEKVSRGKWRVRPPKLRLQAG